MLQPLGFYYVKKPKRFVILSSDKSSERNLSCFFDIIKPRRMEDLQSEEPFSLDPYFSILYCIPLDGGILFTRYLQTWLTLDSSFMTELMPITYFFALFLLPPEGISFT